MTPVDEVIHHRKITIDRSDNIVFCWIGHRQSDIEFTGTSLDKADQTSLFDLSITLFGVGYEITSSNEFIPKNNSGKYNIAFCSDSPLRFFRDGKLLSGINEEKINQLFEQLPDKQLSNDDSPIIRINHNEKSIEQGIFFAMEQLRLMHSFLLVPQSKVVRFMYYDPSYVPQSFTNNPEFLLLSGLDSDDCDILDKFLESFKKEGEKKEINNFLGFDMVSVHNVITDYREALSSLFTKCPDYIKSVINEFRLLVDALAKSTVDPAITDNLPIEHHIKGLPQCIIDKINIGIKGITIIRQATLCLNSNQGLMDQLYDKAKFHKLCRNEEVSTIESGELPPSVINNLKEIVSGGKLPLTTKGGESLSFFTNGQMTETIKQKIIEILRNNCKKLVGTEDYVIQVKESSGGNGTFIIRNECSPKSPHSIDLALETIISHIDNLTISSYRDPNVPVNIHAIIGKKEILLTAPSIQIIIEMNGHLMYCGADYIAYQEYCKTHPEHDAELKYDVLRICTHLQTEGYRGVIGFDALISANGVELVESNNRFQSSTYLLNRAYNDLANTEDPTFSQSKPRIPSIQELNLMAFFGEGFKEKRSKECTIQSYCDQDRLIFTLLRRTIPDIDWNLLDGGGFTISSNELENVPARFSNFIYYNDCSNNNHAKMIHDLVLRYNGSIPMILPKDNQFNFTICSDGNIIGFDTSDTDKCVMESDAYLYKLIFSGGNMVSAYEGGVNIHPNIPSPTTLIRYHDDLDLSNFRLGNTNHDKDEMIDMLDLKIQLINRGIRVECPNILHCIRKGVNNSVDMDLFLFGKKDNRFNYNDSWYNYLPINCPINTVISCFSPFSIKKREGAVDDGYELVDLYYYNKPVYFWKSDILRGKNNMYARLAIDEIENSVLPTGISLRDIILLSTDRLRIQHSSVCKYVQNHKGCNFCEVTASKGNHHHVHLGEKCTKTNTFDIDIIKDAITRAFKLVYKTDYDGQSSAEMKNRLFELEKSRIFTHILIGGATLPGDEGKMIDRIIEISKHVNKEKQNLSDLLKKPEYKKAIEKNRFFIEISESRDGKYTVEDLIDEMTIYLMSIPPSTSNYIDQLHDNGISQVSFNIEIFTSDIARRAMPGKSEIPLSQYIKALSYFVNNYGHSVKNNLNSTKRIVYNELDQVDEQSSNVRIGQYNARTAFIIGLDTDAGLREGIDLILSIGVSPILSIFRPCPGTRYANIMPPSCDYLYRLYVDVSAKCKQHGTIAGPECIFCQNNTLALPNSLMPN